MVDLRLLASVLLEELSALASDEERDARDASWLRGYVMGMANAANIALTFAATGEGGNGEGAGTRADRPRCAAHAGSKADAPADAGLTADTAGTQRQPFATRR